MDRGKCKDPRATLILCASVMVSGSAPVLVSAFGASADTSRRQEMKIGDLVAYKHEDWDRWVGIVIKQIPGTDEIQVVQWNKENNLRTSNPKRDLEVINASR